MIFHIFEEGGRFSSEAELGLCCNEVMQVASEMAVVSDSTIEYHDDHAVSLADDRDKMWVHSQKTKPFILYHPPAFECSTKDRALGNCIYKDVRLSNMIFKVLECERFAGDKVDSVALNLYDDLSPIALKYNACNMNILLSELKAYNVMKRQL